MKSDTIRTLEELAYRRQQVYLSQDPEYRGLRRRQADLQDAFSQTHRRNPALLRQVNDLLDAQSAAAECESDFLFSLGLQMGLELGSLNMLRKI